MCLCTAESRRPTPSYHFLLPPFSTPITAPRSFCAWTLDWRARPSSGSFLPHNVLLPLPRRSSQLLCLDIGLECATDPQAVALAERIRSELPGCRLELNGYLVNHPEHTGLADFD